MMTFSLTKVPGVCKYLLNGHLQEVPVNKCGCVPRFSLQLKLIITIQVPLPKNITIIITFLRLTTSLSLQAQVQQRKVRLSDLFLAHPKSEETQKGAFSSTGSRPSLRVVVRRERVMPFPGIGAKVAGPKKLLRCRMIRCFRMSPDEVETDIGRRRCVERSKKLCVKLFKIALLSNLK